MIGRLLCRVGLHSWDYTGNAFTFAPRLIRCERCRALYGPELHSSEGSAS